MALADVPLKHFLTEAVIPYEDDEVTRLIVDSHDARGVRRRSRADRRRVPRLAAVRRGDRATCWRSVARGITPEMAAAVSQDDAQPGSDPGRARNARSTPRFRNTHRPAGADERAPAAQSSHRRRQRHHRLDPRRPAARLAATPCIGINPASDDPGRRSATCCGCSTTSSRGSQIPTQGCVLAHVTTTLGLIEQGAPVDLVFQSVARHGGRQPQSSASTSRCCARRARRRCRCSAAPSATT